MRLRELPIVLALSLVPFAGSADIDEQCSGPEMLGEVELSAECYAYVVLVAEVLGAAGPCWDEISLDLPTDAWFPQPVSSQGAGSQRRKQAPPVPGETSSIRPPCSSTMRRLMKSPSPVPAPRGLVV